MLQYTKASLKLHLQSWVEGNGADADAEFIAHLDEVIQAGEVKLSVDLNLDSLDSVLTTTTAGTVPEVFKPSNLIVETLLVLDAGLTGRFNLVKRSRAYIEALNSDLVEGIPVAYAEFDGDRWFLAHVPNAAYLIYVHGTFTPVSITDGDDTNTTWFSTRVPDLLALACEIEAARLLKFWARKAEAEAVYTARLDGIRALTAKLQRADIHDLVGNNTRTQRPTIAPEPAATN
jgi:hypothetical protein